MTLGIFATNDDVSDEEACQFKFNLELPALASLQNLVVYLHLEKAVISNTEISKNNVGVFARDYDNLFTNLFNS